MKKFFITFAIYYVLLSLVVGFFALLTGIGGFIPMRVVIAVLLAYTRPIDLDFKKWL